MRHVLVPVLTPQDAEALPNLVQYLAAQKPLAVVVMHNPSLGVTGESATKDVDAKIAATEKAESDAAARKDYPAAEQFRQQLEGLKLERQDVLREGWRKVSPEARDKAYSETILKPFVAAFETSNTTHVRQITLLEDVPNENLFMTLANMGKAWPNCLPMGDFAVMYPRTIPPPEPTLYVSPDRIRPQPLPEPTVTIPSPSEASGGTSTLPTKQKAVAKPVKAKKQASATTSVPDTREGKAEYYRRFHLSLKKAAKDLGVPTEGRSKEDVAQDVLDRQFPVAA